MKVGDLNFFNSHSCERSNSVALYCSFHRGEISGPADMSNVILDCPRGYYYLILFVIFFTYIEKASPFTFVFKGARGVPIQPCLPHRTVRRVHVMPWATPVRRIGTSSSSLRGNEYESKENRIGDKTK